MISGKSNRNDNHNGRQPQWKTTSMEDNHNGRHSQWKTTSMEDNLNGRRPQWKTTSMKEDLNGRQTQWKTTSMEDNLNGRQSQWNTTSRKRYRKQMLSACLASKSCTELGPAQPKLVLFIIHLPHYIFTSQGYAGLGKSWHAYVEQKYKGRGDFLKALIQEFSENELPNLFYIFSIIVYKLHTVHLFENIIL